MTRPPRHWLASAARAGYIAKALLYMTIGSRFGIAARGVVFVAIAFLLARAAARHDPTGAGGLGDALGTLARLGRWPSAAIALGLVAYGVYQLVNARYRRIRLR